MKRVVFSFIILIFVISTFGQDKTTKVKDKKESNFKLYQIQYNGLIGFVDGNGKELIKPKYTDVSPFDEFQKDWALVLQDSLYGFVNNMGVEIVKPTYDAIAPFGEYHKNWAMVIKNGLLGFINSEGIEIVKTQYETISLFGDYYYKWAMVQKDGLFGFINNEGEEVVKPKFDYIIRSHPPVGFYKDGNQEDIEYK